MRIGIVGGGILGMVIAYRLAESGIETVLFEKNNELGGLAGSFKINNSVYLEKYYHHFFMKHRVVISLIKELGLNHALSWHNVKTGLLSKDKIYPLETVLDLFALRELSFRSKLHLSSGFLYHLLNAPNESKEFENENAIEWSYKAFGKEASKLLWEPMLKIKFGAEYKKISAAWLCNRIHERLNSRRGLIFKERLGYLKGSLKILFDSLEKKILERGGKILKGTNVEKITVNRNKCEALICNNRHYKADKVISTVSNPLFLQLVPAFQNDCYFRGLRNIKYQKAVCLVFILKRELNDIYWLNVSGFNTPFAAVVGHTNFVSPHYYSGNHVVYLIRYISKDVSLRFSKESIINEGVSFLDNFFKHFRKSDIIDSYIFHDQFAQPVYFTGYSKLKPCCKTPIKDLFVVNSSQLYPESRTLNSCVRMAEYIARSIINKNH